MGFAPVVVLVRPEIPENLGFIARTMACYGWCDLRVVGDAPGLQRLLDPGSPAWRTASGGEDVLRKAKTYASLSEAIADCQATWGFSRRPHRDAESCDWEQAIAHLKHEVNHSPSLSPAYSKYHLALIFGPESKGLTAHDGESVQLWVKLTMHHPTMSLNLSHAIAIVVQGLYASVQSRDEGETVGVRMGGNDQGAHPVEPGHVAESSPEPEPLAPLGLLDRGWQFVLQAVTEGEIYPAAKAEAQISHLRRLWLRMRLSRGEAEFLIGTIKVFLQGRRARQKPAAPDRD